MFIKQLKQINFNKRNKIETKQKRNKPTKRMSLSTNRSSVGLTSSVNNLKSMAKSNAKPKSKTKEQSKEEIRESLDTVKKTDHNSNQLLLKNRKKFNSMDSKLNVEKQSEEKEEAERLKKIEAERERRQALKDLKKQKEYNIDFLKDRKQMKKKSIETIQRREEELKKQDEIKRFKKNMKLQKQAEKIAAKRNEENEKKKKKEEEERFARYFSAKVADRPVLIYNRFAVGYPVLNRLK
jgi:hypothetical protein